VDDNIVNQRVATALLRGLGCDVDLARTGREALAALEQERYDLVFMDCRMPEMDGYEVTRSLRTREAGARHTPIVAMTANDRPGDREACEAAGMDGYLAKPFGLHELREMLARWLPENETKVPASPAPKQGSEGSFDPEALQGLRALEEAGERGLVAEVVGQFLASTSGRLGSLEDAGRRSDFAATTQIAHSLRGSCGVVGARRMADLCNGLEEAADRGDADGCRRALDALERHWPEVRAALAPLAGR
jgi:CheY-like chemotaxis protein/HPt (histidine-containing phosphotransfer) domain-containing protein